MWSVGSSVGSALLPIQWEDEEDDEEDASLRQPQQQSTSIAFTCKVRFTVCTQGFDALWFFYRREGGGGFRGAPSVEKKERG